MRFGALAALAAAIVLPAAESGTILHYGTVGNISCKRGPCFSRAIGHPAVQRLLLDIASGPRDLAAIDAALRESGVTRQDLEKLRLILRQGDRWRLGFTLWTRADVERVAAVGERHAKSLAKAYLTRRARIDEVLARYPVESVDPAAMAFIVVGCFSLDWDGLRFAAAKRLRTEHEQRPDGRYTPHAAEPVETPSGRLYWASHSSWFGRRAITGFGDHVAPDRIPSTFRTERNARMMLTLRDGARTRVELGEAAVVLDVLAGADWVVSRDGKWRARIPVFSAADRDLIREAVRIGREAMEEWFARDADGLRRELADLSPSRSGVPFEEQFTQVWHYIFGATNRILIEAGWLADPYRVSPARKGYIPTVFDAAIHQ